MELRKQPREEINITLFSALWSSPLIQSDRQNLHVWRLQIVLIFHLIHVYVSNIQTQMCLFKQVPTNQSQPQNNPRSGAQRLLLKRSSLSKRSALSPADCSHASHEEYPSAL